MVKGKWTDDICHFPFTIFHLPFLVRYPHLRMPTCQGRCFSIPVNGLICRWNNLLRRQRNGVTRDWSYVAGAIISRYSEHKARMITVRKSSTYSPVTSCNSRFSPITGL